MNAKFCIKAYPFSMRHSAIIILFILHCFMISGQIDKKWNGYRIEEFDFNGRSARVVFPDQADQERNWIWRARFWGHEPQVDLALLSKGFHLVYVDVIGLYGNKEVVKIWNKYYKFLINKYKLNKKVVLEGMSRGGLNIYNWASKNTEKVACIYADAPVCDIKSWPGGFGKGMGSPEDWKKCLKAYGLTEETVINFKGIPLYNCKKIAKAKIPVIHVCGDSDTSVPIEENTYKLAEIFRAAGGEIKIIVKKGVGHHPHSLKDPTPIVDFILQSMNKQK